MRYKPLTTRLNALLAVSARQNALLAVSAVTIPLTVATAIQPPYTIPSMGCVIANLSIKLLLRTTDVIHRTTLVNLLSILRICFLVIPFTKTKMVP